MPTNTELDFFVSYARRDNADGWITRFLEALQEEHRAFSGERDFKVFFDKDDIRSLDDWQHRIYGSLAASRLFLAFISPNYFASEWCRREWRTWIDVEIAKHILSDGAAPIYIVEVPWLGKTMTEQQVADAIAQLTKRAIEPGLAADALKVTREISLRQLTQVRPFYKEGIEALRREDVRKVLVTLAKDLNDRAQHVADAAKSQSTIPPYNRRFVGRLEELVKLRERLFQGRTGVISGHKESALAGLTGVHGLGGIGKTELAFTYAHAFAGQYPGGRFLIQCERLTDMRLAVLQLDSLFPGAATDEQRKSLDLHFGVLHEALRRRLEDKDKGRILLVLDNVSDLALLAPEQTDLIRNLGSQFHLLATTRLGAPVGQNAANDIHWLTLGELTFDDSLRLLEKHRPFVEAERDAAEKIVRRLGGFALCVEVVGAYLGQHPEETYASFLDKMGLTDLEQVDIAAEQKETQLRRHNNEKRLGAILALTLAKFTATEHTTLEFASLLAPDHVVLPWLRELTAAVHPDASEAWHNIEGRLLSLALLVRGDDAKGDVRVVRCHRLVQDYVRRGMKNQASWQMVVDELVERRDALLQETTHWMDADWEVPPLTALAALWDERGHPGAAKIAHQVGFIWLRLARWSRAEPLMRRAVAIMEASPGGDLIRVAIALNNLAQLLKETNRLAEAEPLMRRALAINEARFGTDHPNVARDLNNLAGLLQETNRLAEAEPLMRRALGILKNAYGHFNVARGYSCLAELLKETNRLAEAEPLHRRALAIREVWYGGDHPEVADSLSNLAQLLTETNRPTEAEPLFRRALAIDEACYGKDHPRVALVLSNLALLLKESNRLAETEPLMRRALAITERVYGDRHPTVATSLGNLAMLLMATNRLAEAVPLMGRALAIDEAAYGNDHPKVACDLNNLAQLLHTGNRLGDAEPLFRRALAIHEATYGHDHPDVARDLNNLGLLLHEGGRLAEAEPLFRRAVAIDKVSYGDRHPEYAWKLNNLARLLQATNRLAEAEPMCRRVVDILENPGGDPLPNYDGALNNLARLLQDTQRLAEAEPLMRRVVGIVLNFTRQNGHPHPHLQGVIDNYTSLLQAMGLNDAEIRRKLNDLLAEYGMSLG